MTQLKDVLHLYLGCEVKNLANETFILTPSLIEAILGLNLSFKPILRPLSDMSDNERDKYVHLHSYPKKNSEQSFSNQLTVVDAECTAYLLSKHFDLFGLIESGQAIDKTTLSNQNLNNTRMNTDPNAKKKDDLDQNLDQQPAENAGVDEGANVSTEGSEEERIDEGSGAANAGEGDE